MNRGIRLMALYAAGCPPTRTRKIAALIEQYLTTGRNESTVKNFLMTLNPYLVLRALDNKKGLNLFTGSVVRAYWLRQHNSQVMTDLRLSTNPRLLLARANDCLISWGKVGRIKSGLVLIARRPLIILPNKKLAFGKSQKVEVGCRFLPRVKVGDYVSVHYNDAKEVLSASDLKTLQHFTYQAIK